MKRNIYSKLLKWNKSLNKKPLLIKGKRQVGKTYIIKQFANEVYKKNYIYINLMEELEFSKIFNTTLNPKKVFEKIEIVYEFKVNKNSLIIIDEIQENKNAINFMKFLNESDYPNNLIATGSWIELAVNKNKGNMPVGQVDIMTMHPMLIDEFILNLYNPLILKQVENCWNHKTKMSDIIHNKLIGYYKKYLFIGGMPEIVAMFKNGRPLEEIVEKQNMLNEMQLNDLGKYLSHSTTLKTKRVYESLSINLMKTYNKFQYKKIKTNVSTPAKAREYEESVTALNLSRVSIPVYMVEKPAISLNVSYNERYFKLFYSDLGLLISSIKIKESQIEAGGFSYLGWINENFVAIHLNQKYCDLFYWYQKQYEVDFLITNSNGDIIPIEVKSGRSKKGYSLSKYIKEQKPKQSIIISKDNFNFSGETICIPFYATYLL